MWRLARPINRRLIADARRASAIRVTLDGRAAKIGREEADEMMNQSAFGRRLRERRKLMGMRQSNVAEGIRETE